MAVTVAEDDDGASENVQGPIESMIKMTIFISNRRDETLRGMAINHSGEFRNDSEKVCEAVCRNSISKRKPGGLFLLMSSIRLVYTQNPSLGTSELELTGICCRLSCLFE